MGDQKSIDFARLLGFATISERISECFDFQDEIVGDKLGAKVGPEGSPMRLPNRAEESPAPRE